MNKVATSQNKTTKSQFKTSVRAGGGIGGVVGDLQAPKTNTSNS